MAVALLVGSVVPSPLGRHPAFGRFGPDKLLHLVGHAGFAAALADALAGCRLDVRATVALSVGVSTAYGLVTGHLQKRVPGRAHERADLVAGMLGSLLGAFGWRYLAGEPRGRRSTGRPIERRDES